MSKEFPELKSRRLRLGQLRAKDIPVIVNYANNENIARTTLNLPFPYQEKDAIFWINSAHEGFQNKWRYIFGIYLNETDEFVGGIGIHLQKKFNRAELGYWVAEPFWGKGICTEATGLIMEFGFNELQLNKIIATHMTHNPASGKVMIKNGMVKEAELIDHYKKGDTYLSVDQYRMLRKDFRSKEEKG